MNEQVYDLAILGGGPGGYVAAIRAAQLGLSVACVDENSNLGGTCLRVGCIPSKALLESSEKYAEARTDLAEHGVMVGDVQLDLAAMHRRRETIVGTLATGVASLLKQNGVMRIQGRGRFAAPGPLRPDNVPPGAMLLALERPELPSHDPRRDGERRRRGRAATRGRRRLLALPSILSVA